MAATMKTVWKSNRAKSKCYVKLNNQAPKSLAEAIQEAKAKLQNPETESHPSKARVERTLAPPKANPQPIARFDKPTVSEELNPAIQVYCIQCQIHVPCSLTKHRLTEEHRKIKILRRLFCAECYEILTSPEALVEHSKELHHGIISRAYPSVKWLQEKLRSTEWKSFPNSKELTSFPNSKELTTIPNSKNTSNYEQLIPIIKTYCKECEIYSNCDLFNHEKTMGHQRISILNRSFCVECDAFFRSPFAYAEHCTEVHHGIISRVFPSSNRLQEKFRSIGSGSVVQAYCEECQMELSCSYDQHIITEEHKRNLCTGIMPWTECKADVPKLHFSDALESKRGPVGLTSVVRIDGFFCRLCRKLLKDEPEAKSSHCKSEEHCSKFKVIVKTTNEAIKVERQ